MEPASNRDLDLILDRLSRDDAFRAWVADDPVAAMASLGVVIGAGQLTDKVILPSREVMMAARLAIKAKLDSAAGAIPFFLSGKL
ncbi:MAG: NHLP-related RiPP peptide [Burkholderiaceae bacterium]|nr:NHLP-related RiPP peptide [Burkholderiaceae bacterium]